MRPGGTDPNGGAPLEATDELLKTLWPVVRGVAAGYARDRDEREDLAQECLIRIADKLPKCRGAVGPVEAWARAVAENRCRSLKRAGPAGGRVGRRPEVYIWLGWLHLRVSTIGFPPFDSRRTDQRRTLRRFSRAFLSCASPALW